MTIRLLAMGGNTCSLLIPNPRQNMQRPGDFIFMGDSMGRDKTEDRYSNREAARRFEAALRGARVAAHQPMKSMTPKRAEAQRKKTKAAKRGA